MNDMTDKRIAVIGLGGVGGYLAGMLIQAFPHVTLVARNERGRSIRERGLILHSDYKGEKEGRPERVVSAVKLLEPQDYIFVCVKNYSLEEVCRDLAGAVTDDTVIIPVMNGVDAGDRVRELMDLNEQGQKAVVVDSLIYIVAFAEPDYSIRQQGMFANLRIGIQDADERQKEKVAEVSRILSEADVDHKVAEDIQCEIWKKYILNCAYNVATAYFDCAIGPLRNDPEKADLYERLLREAYQVAQAKKIHVSERYVESFIHKFYNDYSDDSTSSLQRDVHAGRLSELETFSGYLVREAQKLGVSVPVSERMYEGLRQRYF